MTQQNDEADPDSDEFIRAVERLGNPTTAEVVVEVGCRGRTARLQLESLYEQGKLEREVVSFATKWAVSE